MLSYIMMESMPEILQSVSLLQSLDYDNDFVVPAHRTIDLQKLFKSSQLLRHNQGSLGLEKAHTPNDWTSNTADRRHFVTSAVNWQSPSAHGARLFIERWAASGGNIVRD